MKKTPLKKIGKRGRKLLAEDRKIPRNPICARCGAPSVHKHHIKTKAAHPELRLEPTNIIALCGNCHDFAHREPKEFATWIESRNEE